MSRSTGSFFFRSMAVIFVEKGTSLGMSFKYLALLTGLLLLNVEAVWGTTFDSLGLEFKEGKVLVLHQVEAQETLYGLSKRYFTSVEVIKQQNEIEGSGLSLGSILKIPWGRSLSHQVQQGETLYTIAQKYGVEVEQIRAWNNLSDNSLDINQVLALGQPPVKPPTLPKAKGHHHVVAASETLYGIAQKYGHTIDQMKEWNQLEGTDLSIGDTLWINTPPESQVLPAVIERLEVEEHVVPNPAVEVVTEELPPPSSTPVKAIKEKGIAAVFEEDDTKKYLALHRSAPIGTIMQVRNEMTNLSVFVRVVGKLPDTGNNNNVLVRLSKSAQQGLGALDNRFRVELSYIPNR